jgi:hypothetical protein
VEAAGIGTESSGSEVRECGVWNGSSGGGGGIDQCRDRRWAEW